MKGKIFLSLCIFIFVLSSPIFAQTWSQVNTDGFGDVNNEGASSMAVYNNGLYVGTWNHTSGGEVWEYNGTTWSQVNTDGFGDVNNGRAYSMVVYNNGLYVGTYNSTTGAEVWQYREVGYMMDNAYGNEPLPIGRHLLMSFPP